MILYYYREGDKTPTAFTYSHVYKVVNGKVAGYYIFNNPDSRWNNKWFDETNTEEHEMEYENKYFKAERKYYRKISKTNLMLMML